MTIKFTEAQYLALVEALEVATFPLGILSDAAEEDHVESYVEKIKALDELKDLVYAQAKDFGQEELFTTDEESKKVHLKEEHMDDFALDTIEEYEEWVVYSTLIQGMAAKDFDAKFTNEDLETMSEDVILEKLNGFEEKYDKEFTENGLMNVSVKCA
jgi:hypothetical protein